MFSLDNELLQIEGVLSVNRHRDTVTKGRWSIMTTENNFKRLVQIIKEGLSQWMTKYNEFAQPNHFPPPSLAFKNKGFDDESEGSHASFDTYLSACSSLYTSNEDSNFDSAPAPTVAAPQAWGNISIPKVLDLTVTTLANSAISQDAFDRATRDNAKLNQKVDDLTSTVQQLLSKISELVAQPPRPTPTPSPVLPVDLEQIIAATTRAVMESYARTLQREVVPPIPLAINTQPQSPNRRDTSFESFDDDRTMKSNDH